MASRIFARSLATATQAVKPPVQLFGLDGTYASALYTAAAKSTSIESAAKSLDALKASIAKDSKVGEFLSNPALSSGDRATVVSALAQSSPSIDESVSNLLKVLGENNRLNLLEPIFQQFKILTDAHNGVVEAVVTSSTKLDSKILKKIEASVQKSKFVGQGKTLRLKNDVNPDILGGLIVEVGDRTVDLSISAKIAKLNQALKESI
ncbi:ATP synthase subunit 5, mitochondrial [Wickerhamomyces ciferrii]|uniref:ATP synthase subunit 5, mitochondrial n=1 Tax=Wickerhamomyces ciferrii (strain ATCC 14091 / BCRC 22168 / CBS 111 / JCM 3599 / NBRC 0793 / NRRL Y-1031 F-60-10) TaxID=1206466 RepID=K0KT03_WICCF|nr:ATP synthase subunit 5, mitochondrial [Wickerhamomyces ciferrii]CCH46261.1 ATP synthase subunit 5, mitochondrial [Wickerhamomyces ciferrii]